MVNVTESQIWCRKLTTLISLTSERNKQIWSLFMCTKVHFAKGNLLVICFSNVFLFGTTVSDTTAAVVIQCPAFSFEFHLISACL